MSEQFRNVEQHCRDHVQQYCRDHLEQRLSEPNQTHQANFLALDCRIRDLDQANQDEHVALDRQVDDLERHIDDKVWVDVDELRTSIYEDFDELRREHEEFIRDETNTAVDELKFTLSEAEMSFVGGRLQIT